MDLFEDEIKKKLKEDEEKKLLGSIAFGNLTEEAKQLAIKRGMEAMGKPFTPPAPGKKPSPKPPGGQRMAMDRSRRDPGGKK